MKVKKKKELKTKDDEYITCSRVYIADSSHWNIVL
jgi:hypothetical protein